MRFTRILIGAAVAVTYLAALASSAEGRPGPRKIAVTAKKYEFSPSRIEVKAGEPVEITLTSEDTKHGFVSKDLKIEKVIFDKNHPGAVRFTADKPGTYKFKCAKFCGLGHPKMKGEIVVTP